ncbi:MULTISPECIES: tRNA (N6-isopentenyl adenosine(37)-C2)-methylthiotransferase MiaB [Moraxella]|uniref:tRNA-2-methylthio-N(6)-dimethylallyladenosine synthase n=1 Tax=Moraxella lacunata TaxID=477 RepID=A0A1B8PZ27_MORLA|nr:MULTISPECIES: tRNA (N6-isopentenyl adenosine(37)-C2)-methylthiotransferase MiaB [Moraxella]MBE9579057.1 tRNA (N6-isopentenyl adenosine(37)-C2)-methylthiotransferase MiaB [Moraxella sp. K1664]MBE9588908.1 tRNA (N6-isopentenyl adenosine(37)-C2)-methylthiotransferase MiaB [Moraxella sp. K1630]MBE9596551.1 tRNA (N6-isopentenyl adenosine(37)-C2)-methylthiotransferase MiaB [Moraxella sp. K2450]MDI4483136.1 tRNA (N6-isopentenyl adenosine(37)-C2)-methylthiotransferase MiaB [Moraxella lacunata]MDI45
MTVATFNPKTDTKPHAPTLSQLDLSHLEQLPKDPTAPKKVFIATQGCQMNEYDSQKMGDVLGDSHGMIVTNDINEADVLIMNTCSIREKAQEKVFSELGRWRKLKDKNPHLVIGVGGCVASQEGDNIQKRAPYVDMVFGPQTLHRLPQMYDELTAKTARAKALNVEHTNTGKNGKTRIGVVDVSFPSIEKFDFLPEPKVEGYKAFVSIMEGCSKYCSFCVVPYTRGEELSRPLDDVLAEIDSLAEQGVREINLLGQNVNGYRGEKDDGTICRFSELLHYVAHIDGIERIRYTTSHPLEFTDDIIDAYRHIPKLVSHLHLPVQSGSNAILQAMKRNHTIDIYINQINKLKAIRPDLHLSSDFIIGFPNETDEDFADTLNLAKELDFDHSYSFIYSKRPGTPASDLPDNVSFETKKERLATFQEVIKDSTFAKTRAMVGQTVRVLVEERANRRDGYLHGTADNTRSVIFRGSDELLGKFVNVRIDKAISMHLVEGELVEVLG